MLKLGYPWLSLKSAQLYPYLSRLIQTVSLLIPTYTREGYPGISHYKNLILGYPKTTFLSRLILGYPGISHSSGYPGISRYRSGYGRVSFFQMACAKGQLGVQRLVDCDCPGTTDRKSELWSQCGGPATGLQTVLVTSKAKIETCCTCLSPVRGSGLCQCPASWDVCLWYQLVILAQFSTAYNAGWIRAILRMNVTTWLSCRLKMTTCYPAD